jgi:hypothetical protein
LRIGCICFYEKVKVLHKARLRMKDNRLWVRKRSESSRQRRPAAQTQAAGGRISEFLGYDHHNMESTSATGAILPCPAKGRLLRAYSSRTEEYNQRNKLSPPCITIALSITADGQNRQGKVPRFFGIGYNQRVLLTERPLPGTERGKKAPGKRYRTKSRRSAWSSATATTRPIK